MVEHHRGEVCQVLLFMLHVEGDLPGYIIDPDG